MTAWAWNKDHKDLSQVEPFWPAYSAVRAELAAAGQYPYNDSFTGRIPGIEGPDEGRAIYMLQTLHSVREMELTIAQRRLDGWRDFDPGELAGAAKTIRYAGVAEYGWYMGGTGYREWDDRPRLTPYGVSSVAVLTGKARTRGCLIQGRLLVKPL
jgi:hypothetical protein